MFVHHEQINKTRQETTRDLMNECGWDEGEKEASGLSVCVCVCSQKFSFKDQVSSCWYKRELKISYIFSLFSGNNLSFDLFLVIWFVCALKIVHMKTKTKKWGLLDCNMTISYLLHNTPLHQTKTSSVVSELSLTLLIFFSPSFLHHLLSPPPWRGASMGLLPTN